MIPTSKHLIIGALLVLTALLTDIFIAYQSLIYILGAIYLLLIILDGIRLLMMPAIMAERSIDNNIPVKEWVEVGLTLRLTQGPKQKLLLDEIRDEVFSVQKLPARVELSPEQTLELHYRIKASQRGQHSISALQYLRFSPLQLWSRKITLPLKKILKVQPNYQTISNLVLQGEEHAVAHMGLRQQRRRGEGTDFNQLREYRPGDAMRKIDWKASSRVNKLISKEFRDEQDQQLVFLLDTGRRMRHTEGNNVFMDDTINAMLLLSYIASQQGDSVGFMAFGNSDHWCPPQKKQSIVKHLTDHCFDIQPGLVHSDYLRSAQRLIELQKRRALVVILTNSRDEDSEDLKKSVVLLRQRHLVAIADLQEDFFAQLEQDNQVTSEQALTYLASQDYLHSRQQMQHSLTSLSAVYLDCSAKNLPANLINSYQQIKASGRL